MPLLPATALVGGGRLARGRGLVRGLGALIGGRGAIALIGGLGGAPGGVGSSWIVGHRRVGISA